MFLETGPAFGSKVSFLGLNWIDFHGYISCKLGIRKRHIKVKNLEKKKAINNPLRFLINFSPKQAATRKLLCLPIKYKI